jgi:hypothetical protein
MRCGTSIGTQPTKSSNPTTHSAGFAGKRSQAKRIRPYGREAMRADAREGSYRFFFLDAAAA